jgi:hypothetical protein
MGIQNKGFKAEVRNISFKVDKEVIILSVLVHWGVVLQCMCKKIPCHYLDNIMMMMMVMKTIHHWL